MHGVLVSFFVNKYFVGPMELIVGAGDICLHLSMSAMVFFDCMASSYFFVLIEFILFIVLQKLLKSMFIMLGISLYNMSYDILYEFSTDVGSILLQNLSSNSPDNECSFFGIL